MSALIVDLFPVAFLIGEAAPAPVPVPNPYHRALRPAGTPGATVGAKRGRPKGGKNKADAKKPGRNARTASAEEAVNNTPSITSMWSPRASTPSPSGSAPSPTANAPSQSASAPSPSAPNSSSGGGRDDAGSSGASAGGGNCSGGGCDGGSSSGASGGGGSSGSSSGGGRDGGGSGAGSSVGGRDSGGSGGGGSGGGSATDSIPYTPQSRLIDEIKASIKASRKHVNGGVKRTSEFPYNGGWAYPPLPALQKAGGEWIRGSIVDWYTYDTILVITAGVFRVRICSSSSIVSRCS